MYVFEFNKSRYNKINKVLMVFRYPNRYMTLVVRHAKRNGSAKN